MRRTTKGPPWHWISATSSPVRLAGWGIATASARSMCAPVDGIDDVAEAHRARRALGGMRRAEESVEDFESARAGEADDRDGADAGGGGGGDDRVGGVHGNLEERNCSGTHRGFHTSLGRGDPCTQG